jgi:hypothetical protein
VPGTLAKHTLIGGLADERDDARHELDCDCLEPLVCTREVGRTKVARPAGGSAGGIREADVESQELPELVRLEETRREAGGV